ncbi:MAG: hypothetical protein LBN27_09235 [Prevotellaceae bacterium]|jgi:hypothetical protein|nr:hypothetical protein [Prevotellaceae bacterium]
MKRETIYTDAPPEIEEAFKHAVIIDDFLPAPEFLVRRKVKEQFADNDFVLRTHTHTHARSTHRRFATAGV